MEPLDLSRNALARALGVPPNRITRIVGGERAITADTALRLARYFRTSPQFWLNLQTHYDLTLATRTATSALEQIVPHASIETTEPPSETPHLSIAIPPVLIDQGALERSYPDLKQWSLVADVHDVPYESYG